MIKHGHIIPAGTSGSNNLDTSDYLALDGRVVSWG